MLQCSIPRVASTNSEGSPIAPAADAFLARGISSLEAPLLMHFGPHVSDNVLRDLGDSFWGNSARAAMARDPSSDVTLPTL